MKYTRKIIDAILHDDFIDCVFDIAFVVVIIAYVIWVIVYTIKEFI